MIRGQWIKPFGYDGLRSICDISNGVGLENKDWEDSGNEWRAEPFNLAGDVGFLSNNNPQTSNKNCFRVDSVFWN